MPTPGSSSSARPTASRANPQAESQSGARQVKGQVRDLIGSIAIARVGLSTIVMEGTTARTLRRAACHISGTAFPGESGNVAISGHRDTFFRPLRNIRQDDIITMTTLRGQYRYRVVSTQIVPPSDISVLAASDTQTLTLVTCYPFYFVGAAPDRFIVRAQRII